MKRSQPLNPATTPNDDDQDLLSRTEHSSMEDLNHELREQQDRLLELKRQQDEIERRKRELEDLNKKRNELNTGKKAMREKLGRAIAVLERAEYDTRREIEQIQLTRQAFTEHLSVIESIDPSLWTPQNMDDELTRAISQIDNSRAIYNQSRARIDALSGQDIDSGETRAESEESDEENLSALDTSFFELARRGFAFTLPLIIFLAILFFVFLTRH
jgi:flagellar biosynthesis regulator FlaF